MGHTIVPEAEKILDKEFPVLNHGFVRLVDYMGGDSRIVQSARVSYGDGTKTVREDAGLIDYLLRHQHTSPFEQVVLTFHVKMPIFVARQWIRHRTARVNEISGRYSIMRDEFYLPADMDVAKQSTDNKQGRSTEPVTHQYAAEVQKKLEAYEMIASPSSAPALEVQPEVEVDVEPELFNQEPQFSVAPEPVKIKKSTKDKILEMYKQDFTSQYIAKELGISVSEVDFLINMLKNNK